MPILPTDPGERKKLPIGTGVLKYFPLALAEVAKASVVGNKQHLAGEPLRWDRSKSSDDFDAMIRHAIQLDDPDENGVSHVGAMMWRALAVGEKILEGRQKQARAQEAPQRESNVLWDPDDHI